MDIKRDFENIYYDTGAPDFTPIDKNAGIDLTKLKVNEANFEDGKTYWWRVRYRDRNLQWSDWSEEKSFVFGTETDVESNTAKVPTESKLYMNYPNPFNPTTMIKFDISKAGHVKLAVYSIEGRLIRTLVDKNFNPGKFSINWDGRDVSGQQVPSGTYFYRLVTDKYDDVKKAILIK